MPSLLTSLRLYMQQYPVQANMLAGKVILVTGAGDGIGRQAALSFAEYGATLILLGRTQKKLESVYDEIVANGGAQPAIIVADLNKESTEWHQGLAETLESQFGRLDGLLHNASLLGKLAPFAQIPAREFAEVMQVNVHSQFHMTQALLPLLRQSNSGSVVFTSSSVGKKGRAFWGSYAISKFATEGMMEVLADEYENTPLRFNCINPGATRTAMRAKAYPAEDPNTLKTPADLMPLYLYLMSDNSQTISGKTFVAQPK